MNEYDATELAFKNGYEKGKAEGAKEIFKELDEALAHCLQSYPYAISRYCEIRRKHTEK